MSQFISSAGALLLKVGVVAFLVNEVRGIVLAGPVLYAMYRSGGTWMALWLELCALRDESLKTSRYGAAHFSAATNSAMIAPDSAQHTMNPIVSTRSHLQNSHDDPGNSFV